VTGLIAGDYHRPVEVSNPDFDLMLKEEAITCAVCHVRDGFVIGPYGNTEAPHPVKKDPPILSVQACLSCHNVKHGGVSGRVSLVASSRREATMIVPTFTGFWNKGSLERRMKPDWSHSARENLVRREDWLRR